ncbi:DUF4190 domain-containing protein [Subtercola frigoramans]|uniref:Peptidyl-prolyl cis-trans isomerase B (Cyclophilin B) n=1 Tax=Subtercola frigoramans TaxID=120298 RepID=A0ABS2L6G3_9MICO|nr:DUF4190 domain-containing protein [Subtercola frigoramans]MBM7472688.1 peptidyl-prolyl cis-trans isomerase B (cyclophilin B) [Subtercola frigoramans]
MTDPSQNPPGDHHQPQPVNYGTTPIASVEGQPGTAPYAGQSQYGEQGQYAAAPPAAYGAARTNVLAIVAFALSFVVPLAAIVTGHIALGQIKRTGEQGHGFALAGTIIGYALTGLALIMVIAYVAFFIVLIAVAATNGQYSTGRYATY